MILMEKLNKKRSFNFGFQKGWYVPSKSKTIRNGCTYSYNNFFINVDGKDYDVVYSYRYQDYGIWFTEYRLVPLVGFTYKYLYYSEEGDIITIREKENTRPKIVELSKINLAKFMHNGRLVY